MLGQLRQVCVNAFFGQELHEGEQFQLFAIHVVEQKSIVCEQLNHTLEAQVLVTSRYQEEEARKEVHPLAVAELGVETGDSPQQLKQLLVSDGLSIVF